MKFLIQSGKNCPGSSLRVNDKLQPRWSGSYLLIILQHRLVQNTSSTIGMTLILDFDARCFKMMEKMMEKEEERKGGKGEPLLQDVSTCSPPCCSAVAGNLLLLASPLHQVI